MNESVDALIKNVYRKFINALQSKLLSALLGIYVFQAG